MAVYADYSYYSNTYKGMMAQADFDRLCRRASAYLDTVTSGRAAAYAPQEKVRDCCCALCDDYLLMEQGGGVASETNDGVSVSYAIGISNSMSESQRLRRTLNTYLGGTGLLFRGVSP